MFTKSRKKFNTTIESRKLFFGISSFNQLKNSIQGISQKVLTTNLRKLEADGVITRTVFDESVIKVEYSITGLGHELTKIFISVKDWAEKNWKQVGSCNEKFENKKKV